MPNRRRGSFDVCGTPAKVLTCVNEDDHRSPSSTYELRI